MIQEQVGYALASWARFEGSVSDDLLKAITAAFALVATVDGDVATAELDGFVRVLQQQSDHLPALDFTQVKSQFRDIAGAMLTDPESGRSHALQCIGAVQGNAEQCELVRSAAEIAVVADQRTLAKEQAVLAQICDALSIETR